MKASANNATPVSCTVPGNGTYTCGGISPYVSGTPIMVYIDGHSSNANTVTISGGSNISNLPIYISRLSAGNNNSSMPTNSDICAFSSYPASGDNTFTCSGSDITVLSGIEMHIMTPASASYYTGGGKILTNTSGGLLHLDDSASMWLTTDNSIIGGGIAIDSGQFYILIQNR
jgi:hypothetical protein